MYNFIWDGKPDKIKREILTSEYDKEGLRMIDIEKFIWSLKISWVKRILQTESISLLKHLYENVLNNLVTSFNFNAISEKLTLLNISIKKLFIEIYYYHGQNLPTKQTITMKSFGTIPIFALAKHDFLQK